MGEVFAKVHHVNIYFQSKAISQNFQILCEDKKKYRFSIERGFFFHALHLCQWFIAAIYLTLYCNYEYGLYQAKDRLLKYNYCNMTSYFYIETDYVIILSMICFVQASLAQKLWSNFKETYYIFLEILTITNLLVLSIRLNESFSNDGQNIFVLSIVIYCANMALMPTEYDMIQKHRYLKKAFQRIMRKAMQKNTVLSE